MELGRGLKAEQARVEQLLHSKDLLIRELQGRGETKQGNESDYDHRLDDDISDNTKNITSDSIEENMLNDKVDIENEMIISDPKNITSEVDIISDKADIESEIIQAEVWNTISEPKVTKSSSNISGPTALSTIPKVLSIKGPKPPLASRESVNAKLCLSQPKVIDYVLVTKQRSDISPISGLYVLDTTSDATNDNNAVTPVHAMTNHRRVLKPSDIKYRDRRRAVSMSDKTRVTYWTDTYL